MANLYNDRESERARSGRYSEDYRQAGRGPQERGYEGQGRDYEERGYRDRSEGEMRAQFGNDDYDWQRRQGEGRLEEGWYGRGDGYGRERSFTRSSRGEYEPGTAGYGREFGQGSSRRFAGGRDYDRGRSSENWTDFGGERGYGGERESERNRREDAYGNESRYRENDSWSVRGPYTGHGPQGYKRSDERITEDINERLTQHGYIDASQIQVKVKEGEVTLTGNVSDRHTKRMVEDLVEACSGVKEVQNQLRVKQESQSFSTQQNQAMQGQHEMKRSATK